ncbi:hypothetical protein [Hymenobacter terricola]|uniref:hypothetical protein n=1 Tax=Hymenobacter terricola TaxID=2819236 RepID=UPI001B310B6D|nr:hypothetical protein [Hymenobacter terricola]
MGFLLFGAGSRAAQAWAWAQARPALTAVALLLVVYAIYLPNSGFHALYYDAAQYWTLGRQYGKTGAFELFSFASSMRGYLLPLLLAPFAIAGPHLGLEPIVLMWPLGVITAAVLFGALGPALWRAAAGPAAPAVSLARRLVFGLLGFGLWRDYFNFPLSDFPGLFALAAALWALLSGRTVLGGLLAGIALGASANMRPVFVMVLPFAGLLALLPQHTPPGASAAPAGRKNWVWRGAIIAGLAAVLAPQFAINSHNFKRHTPWVLAKDSRYPDGLYLQQLEWGLQYQKYETSVADDFPRPQMFFSDPRGVALFATLRRPKLESQAQYLQLAKQHPFVIMGSWLRHVFNGLDLQYPSPYVRRVYVASWPLAWLNYTLLLGGCVVLLSKRNRFGTRRRGGLVLAALLMPCLGAVPVAIECRFLLPLHLLLSAAVAFGAHPLRAWRAATTKRRAAWALGYAAVMVVAFSTSADCQIQLEKGPRNLDGSALYTEVGPSE